MMGLAPAITLLVGLRLAFSDLEGKHPGQYQFVGLRYSTILTAAIFVLLAG
jgi:hypothetical protein